MRIILSSVLALGFMPAGVRAAGTSPDPIFNPAEILAFAVADRDQIATPAAVAAEKAPQAPAFSFPDNLVLSSEGRSLGVLGTKLKITHATGQNRIEVVGYIKEAIVDARRFTAKHLGLRPRMTLQLWDGPEKKMLASATADLITYAYTVNVVDQQGRHLGSFKEDLLAAFANNNSEVIHGDLGKFASFYGIYDNESRLVARSIKSQDSTGVDFYIQRAVYDEKGAEIIRFDADKPVAHMAKVPEWRVDILEPAFMGADQPGKIDPRVLIMIPAYQNFVSKERLLEQLPQ